MVKVCEHKRGIQYYMNYYEICTINVYGYSLILFFKLFNMSLLKAWVRIFKKF